MLNNVDGSGLIGNNNQSSLFSTGGAQTSSTSAPSLQSLVSDSMQLQQMPSSSLQQSLLQLVDNAIIQDLTQSSSSNAQQSPLEQMLAAMNGGNSGGTSSAGGGNSELNVLSALASAAGSNANIGQELGLLNQLNSSANAPGGGTSGTTGGSSGSPTGSAFSSPEAFPETSLIPPPPGGSSFGGSTAGLNTAETNADVHSFNITSSGDPHLSSTIDGTTSSNNNEGSQNDLVDANGSFQGGYQVSTQVGSQAANGATYNNQVGVQVDGSSVSVTHNDSGNPTVTVTNATGSAQTLSAGQSITTKDGATITESTKGQVTVTDNNSQGGTASTVIGNSSDNKGLDVNTSGSNVTIGGFEAAYSQNSAATASQTESGSQI